MNFDELSALLQIMSVTRPKHWSDDCFYTRG